VRSPIVESLPGLRERTFDLLLARPPHDDHRTMEGIHSEFLLEDPMIVVAGAHSPWARRRKIDLADLIDAPWIPPPPDGLSHRFIADACRKRSLESPAVTLLSSTIDLRVGLLGSGRFVSVLPRSVYLRDRVRHGLKMLPVAMPKQSWPITLFTLKHRTLSPVIERFIACAHEVAKANSS
jgi:DNA-binding transcriptional LysR family regulator